MSKTNNKHVVIFFSKEAGNYVVTDPKQWARANRNYFPKYSFSDTQNNAPRTASIVNVLESKLGFKTTVYNDSFITVHYNLNPELNFQ